MQTKTNENISESNIKVFSNNAAINISLTNILLQRIMKNKSTEERLSSQKSCFKNYHNWTNKLKKLNIYQYYTKTEKDSIMTRSRRRRCHTTQSLQRLCNMTQSPQRRCHTTQSLQQRCHTTQSLQPLCNTLQSLQQLCKTTQSLQWLCKTT